MFDKIKLSKLSQFVGGTISKVGNTITFAPSSLDVYKRHEYHAGLIIKSSDKEKINHLLDEYQKRFYNDFFTTAQMAERPSD